ncbi:MAG: F0F1 ATP synthase subunit B [Candidatus Nanopelagicales bacterium]
MTWLLAAEEGGSNVLRIPMFEFVIGLVAFAIVFGTLAKFALPKIKQTLDERADAIEGGIKRAEEAQAQAQQTLEQYQEQMAAARAEVAEIRQQAEAERATVMEEARKAAEAQAQQIAANATAQIEAEKAKALADLRKSMGGVATDLAGRIVGESMSDDERARGVVDRFIAELEQASAQGGDN